MRLLGHLGAAARGAAGRVLPGHRRAGRRADRRAGLAQLADRRGRPGLKLLALIDRDGPPRDYYPHLTALSARADRAGSVHRRRRTGRRGIARAARVSVQPVTTRSSTSSTGVLQRGLVGLRA